MRREEAVTLLRLFVSLLRRVRGTLGGSGRRGRGVGHPSRVVNGGGIDAHNGCLLSSDSRGPEYNREKAYVLSNARIGSVDNGRLFFRSLTMNALLRGDW